MIETKRLILRNIEKDDFSAIQSYTSDIENVKYMSFGPNDESKTRNFINECLEHSKKEPRIHYDFAIILKDSGMGKMIGSCGIYLDEGLYQGFLGWILHKDYWKKGYMPEVGHALLELGFDKLNLHRIYAYCNDDNYGSYRVMEKIGMRREGHFIKNQKGREKIDPPWISTFQYAILKEEWENLDKG
ncbi:MAG: GNAT family N-acetyltransferase [Clostridiales bacterium]|nr:GNAT family N-acetyltransferase [Clostridiales bacterium]